MCFPVLHPVSPRCAYHCSVGVAGIGWRFIWRGKMIRSEGKSGDWESKQRGVTRGAGFDDAWRNKWWSGLDRVHYKWWSGR